MKNLNKNNEIKIKILEECTDDNWKEKEIFWISQIENLTNHTIGGESGHGLLYNITYEEAKELIKSYNIKSKNEWERFIINNKIENFPSDPYEYFIDKGWISWGDFLGTNRTQDNLLALNYISYNNAKNWIKNNLNNVNTLVEWKKLVKENKIPDFIPNRADRFYKKRGWVSWGDFLGTGRIANQFKEFISYEEAKKIIQSLNIKSINEYKKRYNNEIKKFNIPAQPYETYGNKGWTDWSEFLGTGRKQDNLLALNYISYNEAKNWIKNNLKIWSEGDWKKLVKENDIPNFLPNNPQIFYNKKERGWLGWIDFLGTEYKQNNLKCLTYEEAKTWVLTNIKVKTTKYWKNLSKNNQIPSFIPKRPDIYYKSYDRGWVSWNDFFSNDQISRQLIKFMTYEDAKLWIKDNININYSTEWKQLVKENKIIETIPRIPVFYYKKDRGWISWKDFLGK
jgi:hypothetical protein